jgi:lipoprotein-releasing system permease protein
MPPLRSTPDAWYVPLLEWWEQLHGGMRIGIAIAVALAAIALLLTVYRRLKPGRRLIAFTVCLALVTGAFSIWAFLLPETRGSHFVLSHQLVRVGAALSATLTVIGLLGLSVPRVLNFFEGSRFVTFVAARHVRSEKSGFLTVISFLSIAGVGVSSFALCAVISIMGGFGADLKSKILDNNAHIRVEGEAPVGFDFWRDTLDRVRLVRGVRAATPVATGEVMASSSTNTAGVLLRGVDTETIGQVVDVPQLLDVGDFRYLDDPRALKELPPDTPIGLGPTGEYFLKGPELSALQDNRDESDVYPGVVMGKELAKNLHVYVGDVVTLVSPLGDLGPMGVMPRTRKFRVAGIFDSGMYEYDASHAYVKIEEAQRFLDLKHLVTAIEVRVHEVERVEQVTPAVRAALERDDLRVRDWKELNRNLFGALELEKVMTFVILSIAIAVASFCIICTLLLMVTEKSKEIAILKAMGTSDRTILKVFMAEGMFIGGVGTVFGVVTGFIAMKGLKTFGVRLDPEVYYITNLPVTVEPLDYLLVAVCAFAITTLATLYPASAASALRPVDGIRYE